MMKNVISLILLFICFNVTSVAQVTIGSSEVPEKAALLDLKTLESDEYGTQLVSSENGGLLLPRVEIFNIYDLGVFRNVTGLDEDREKLIHTGLTVYNIGTEIPPAANRASAYTLVEAGIYVWDGNKWQKAGIKREKNFFYMPSIEIDLSSAPDGIDLYEKYHQQFRSPKAASTYDPIPVFYREELDYYITDYDESIFADMDVSADGIMTYTLQNDIPADACCSYINIVFVVK